MVKSSHFLHCLQSGINISVVTPTQEFFKRIHMFLFRSFLQVLIILSSWRRPFSRLQNGNIVLDCHSIFYQYDVFTEFCFKRITITQNFAKCNKGGKFCVLLFLVVFERFFFGRNLLVSDVLYAFKKESRLFAPPRNFMISKSWLSPNLEEMY